MKYVYLNAKEDLGLHLLSHSTEMLRPKFILNLYRENLSLIMILDEEYCSR